MIDLSYEPKHEPKRIEPEEIVVAVLACAVWLWILIGIMGGC